MRVDQLFETPLPLDWDEDVFSHRTTFNKKIQYALQRAEKVGAGSSRVAFITDYMGRKTVLKIAKNKKGIAQNKEEAKILDDAYAVDSGVFIPMIDYDEKNRNQPIWIHTEFAKPLRKSDFYRIHGYSLEEMVNWIEDKVGKNRLVWVDDETYDKLEEDEFAAEVLNMVHTYDLVGGDVQRAANWGLYAGTTVIIDIGLTAEVFKLHYKRF